MSLLQKYRQATAENSEFRESLCRARERARRLIGRSQHGWETLTSGMELEELWAQFKSEARESSLLYRLDLWSTKLPTHRSWRYPFQLGRAFLWSILRKLSPPRRLFLLGLIVLAAFSVAGVHFLVFTPSVEFLIAFLGLLLLLVLVLGDHISMKRDLEIAREIQRWLVPREAPEVGAMDIAFATQPAKTVGGDYYDAFVRAGNGRLLVVAADVAGKSIPAAMLMATFQASLRALAASRDSLAELVADLNQTVCATSYNGRFTTAFLAEFSPEASELRYVCAGHNPAIIRRANGECEKLEVASLPFGIRAEEHYEAVSARLGPDDLLVIYTDGVTDARNTKRVEFGEERLLELLQAATPLNAAALVSEVMVRVNRFIGSAAQHDDITCLVLRRR
jgi:phosphoserine phosphatase RsbU/P